MEEIPFVKEFPFTYGESDTLSPLVRRVIANNPGPFTYTGTGTYLIGAGRDIALIDPGPDDKAHLDALMRAADGRLSHILITHTHFDHCAGAATLSAMSGAPIYAFGPHPENNAPPLQEHNLEEGEDRDFQPDHILYDGDLLKGDGWTLKAIHTPGHISNHLCFALQEEKALFTGDHMMGWATTVIVPPSGNMGDYFNSLELLLARDDEIYYPTHGAPIKSPHRFVRAVKAHRHIRDGQIMEHLKKGPALISDIVATMYANVDKRLHGAAAMNVFAHLIRLVDIGSVTADGPATLKATYQLAE